MTGFKLKNRVLAVALCVLVVGGIAGIIFLRGGERAEATVSLPGIVELKASGDTFTILEIQHHWLTADLLAYLTSLTSDLYPPRMIEKHSRSQ